jgi:membrane protein
MRVRDGFDTLDRLQQRHRVLGFPLAVRQKYSDDQGGSLAATIAYYGFFSVFPLLLVLVTVLGYVLQGRPHLEHRIVGSALGQFPIVGNELRQQSLRGNGVALAVGALASVWTGIGVLLAAENAMSRLWDVPRPRRPSFFAARVRALLLLGLLGGGLLVMAALSAVGTAGGSLGLAVRLGVIVASLVAGFPLFWVAFRLLTPTAIAWRCLRGGAAAAAVGYEALQLLGSYYVSHVLRHASNVYGTFGLVIGLLSWIYLTATVVLVAAEANVVATRRLWPRSLRSAPTTDADGSEAAGVPWFKLARAGNPRSMTTIERFQKLQVELVRAGFDSELHAAADRGNAVLTMYVELTKQTAADIEKLDALTATHGLTCVIGDDSRAAITLAAG